MSDSIPNVSSNEIEIYGAMKSFEEQKHYQGSMLIGALFKHAIADCNLHHNMDIFLGIGRLFANNELDIAIIDREITGHSSDNKCSNGCLHLLWKTIYPNLCYPKCLLIYTWDYMWLIERIATIIDSEDFTHVLRQIALDRGLLVQSPISQCDSVARIAGSRNALKSFLKYLKPLFKVESSHAYHDYYDYYDGDNDEYFENEIMDYDGNFRIKMFGFVFNKLQCVFEIGSVASCSGIMLYLNHDGISIECYNPLSQLPNFHTGNIHKLQVIPDYYYDDNLAILWEKFCSVSTSFYKTRLYCTLSNKSLFSNIVSKKINSAQWGSIGGDLAIDTIPKILKCWTSKQHNHIPDVIIKYIMQFLIQDNCVRTTCDRCKSPSAKQLALITRCCGEYICVECVVSDVGWGYDCVDQDCRDCST
jgi:hypothetical protein